MAIRFPFVARIGISKIKRTSKFNFLGSRAAETAGGLHHPAGSLQPGMRFLAIYELVSMRVIELIKIKNKK